MKKLRALLFLMLATIVGGVSATLIYYEGFEDVSYAVEIGIDAYVDAEVHNIIDISAEGSSAGFYFCENENNELELCTLGTIDVSATWNISGEQLENLVGQEIIAAYVRISSIDGVSQYHHREYDENGEISHEEYIDVFTYSTEEKLITNIAFDENGEMTANADDVEYHYLFELASWCTSDFLKINEDINLDNYTNLQEFMNCFDTAYINVEIIFRAI